MKYQFIYFMMRLIVCVLLSLSFIEPLAHADQLDPYQNSGNNNMAYDLISKFYCGGNIGDSIFTENEVSFNNNIASLNSSALDFGLFGGYKFNSYAALEINFQQLGKLTIKNNNNWLTSYDATINNVSLDGLLSYPVLFNGQYTLNLYAKAGYGLNDTNYSYNINHNSSSDAEHLVRGAYNAGFGINMDFRSNLSTRIDYTFYQTHYPLLDYGTSQGAHVFEWGIYYNF